MAYTNNASQIVYDLICEKIRNQEWKPNDKIWTEQKLSTVLGVSRVAVREAVEKLVNSSILRKIQGSGTYVNETKIISFTTPPTYNMSITDIIDVLKFRSTFEPGNVKFFIENATDKDIAQLEAVVKKMRYHHKEKDQFFMYDVKFHNQIAKGTKNPIIIKITDFLGDLMSTHLHIMTDYIGPEIGLEYHDLILSFIKKGDDETASILMKRHLEEAIEEIDKVAKMRGEL